MGVKYVDDFSFPSDFGFTGSAADRSVTTVKSHERKRPQRFAEGGSVSSMPPAIAKIIGKRPSQRSAAEQKLVDDYNDSKAAIPIVKDRTPAAAPPAASGEGPLSTLDIMKGKGRRLQEQKLGLKRGGKAHKPFKYAEGGSVDSALERRSKPTNELDVESGGRSPLRPGFKKGGKMRGAKCAIGGPVKAKHGGAMKSDLAQDKRMIGAAIKKHVAAPKPRGHGVRS